jgi:hypothetical protein
MLINGWIMQLLIDDSLVASGEINEDSMSVLNTPILNRYGKNKS